MMNSSSGRVSVVKIWMFLALLCATTNAGRTSPPSDLSTHGSQSHWENGGQQLPSVAESLNDTPEDDWRMSLPSELRNRNGAPLHRVELNGAVIYLLGTSHVSRTSCDDARLLMQHVRPGE